jgi:hypothetical protein
MTLSNARDYFVMHSQGVSGASSRERVSDETTSVTLKIPD